MSQLFLDCHILEETREGKPPVRTRPFYTFSCPHLLNQSTSPPVWGGPPNSAVAFRPKSWRPGPPFPYKTFEEKASVPRTEGAWVWAEYRPFSVPLAQHAPLLPLWSCCKLDTDVTVVLRQSVRSLRQKCDFCMQVRSVAWTLSFSLSPSIPLSLPHTLVLNLAWPSHHRVQCSMLNKNYL